LALKFNRLTRDAVRGMKPGEIINEHGIVADCLANGDIRYRVNIMVDGQRIHRTVGRESEGATRSQAEKLIEQFRTDARHGRLDLPAGRKRHRTVSEGADEYLERMEAAGGKNLPNKRRHFEQHLKPFLGRDRLDKLTEFRLLQYRKHRAAQGAKEATINRELATLSHLLSVAASTGQDGWKWIKPDAKPKIPKAAEVRKHIDILTPEEDERLLRAAMQDQDPDIWLFVLIATNAPMRHTEITSRRFDEVDWQTCRMNIATAKAGQRSQPITPALRDVLLKERELREDPNGWIFPSRSRTAKLPHRHSMAKSFARVVKRAGMDPRKVTPHVLRHTGISRLLMAGVDLKTAQTISGHKTVTMLMHYAHVLAPHVDQAIGLLNRPVPDAITPKLHTPFASQANARGRE
jgi:integrase